MFKPIALLALLPAAWSADLFPLRTGNSWTYRDPVTGDSFTIRVGTPAETGGRVYYALSGYLPRPALARLDDKGGLAYLDNDTGQERVLTSFAPFEQGSWEAPQRPCPEQLGRTLEKRAVIDGPAGRFDNALEIRYDVIGCADVGVQAEWYVENIGMVRRTMGTIAGPRTYDLVFARVGATEIEAGPAGRFSVSVSQTGPLTIAMRLRTDPVASIALRFDSGQEYDATIEDASGKVVWRWSDGLGFIQAVHERVVTGEWTITIPVAGDGAPRFMAESPRRSNAHAAAASLPPGEYKVRGWLTTSGPAPAFAATAVLTVAGK